MKTVKEPPKLLTLFGQHENGVFITRQEISPVIIADVLGAICNFPCQVDDQYRKCPGSYDELRAEILTLPKNEKDFTDFLFWLPFAEDLDCAATEGLKRYLQATSETNIAEYVKHRSYFLERVIQLG